ncbi:DUF4011 domain-containing protein [Pseudarthrobacter sp. C1]|uniref:DUF4011 domain-containing protein n=1 Tax=Pseudarthrobacter sp. C1 TaxID=3108940 RepID=UPI002B05C012|nr:DUF4011 domain-containing protein [Pseudarthrobacter sp. C1]MEA3549227.1 DUF4011 domain-containing protein [Pseudarthrobacter sp. C1]
MGLSNREYVGRALETLAIGLEPYIASSLESVAPGVPWTKILKHKDANAGRTANSYSPTDLSVQLRVMTEALGSLGYPFNLGHDARSHASELRQVRNLWAHNEAFDDADTYRALDTARRLAKQLELEDAASELAALRDEFTKRDETVVVPEVADPVTGGGEEGSVLPLDVADNKILQHTVSVEITAAESLSYAMVHNGFKFVRQIKITNPGVEIRGAVVRINVHSSAGKISEDFQQYVDLAAGQAMVLDDVDVHVSATTMYELSDQQRGRVVVTIESAATGVEAAEIGKAEVGLQLLPAQLWIAGKGLVSYEFLAAFVQPHHPAIVPLVSEAADILGKGTGRSSLDGYTEDAERVDEIVFALAQAASNRDIRYSMPPASWGLQGQQVRTPAQVLEGRLGTCLDTAVVMAAALESCGIAPLLWVVDGHAFLGYWREDRTLPTAASDDVLELVSLVQRGFVGLVETTMLTGSHPITPAMLRSSLEAEYIETGHDKIQAVTDVRRARLDGIYPLPARTTNETGASVVTNYVPEAKAAPVAPEKRGRGAAPGRSTSSIPPRVTQWKNALLDLSLRNRLINFTDTARFPLAVPSTWMGRFEDLINNGTPVSLLPSNQLSAIHQERGIRFGRDLPQDELIALLSSKKAVFAEVSEDAYNSKMRGLAYKAKTQLEETGANNLYLALGSLLWELDGRTLRSPLVLVPVNLASAGRQGLYRVALDETGQSTPNYCLLEKLSQAHGLKIPGLAEPAEDGSGIDLDAAFHAVREAVSAKGLAFRVENTVDLSMLQFAKFRLWKDLDENWEQFGKNRLVDHLINSPTELFHEPVKAGEETDLDALAAKCPIPADSTQLQAVASAVAGQTFVLEGPPGTGKSQTITNLLTRAIVEGKRVLFVAEKRAALDVVQKRLEEVGMGPFSLDLHDKGSKPAMVRAQIKHALELRLDADRQQLDTASTDLASARRSLIRYASRLHEENGARLSLYSARTKTLTFDPNDPLLPLSTTFTSAANEAVLERVRAALRELPEYTDHARPTENHPWRFVTAPPDPADAVRITREGRRIDEALDAVASVEGLSDVVSSATSPSELHVLAALLEDRTVPVETLDAVRAGEWSAGAQHLENVVAAFAAVNHPGLDKARPEAMDLPLPEILRRAEEAAASGFFGRKTRLLAVAAELDSVLHPGTTIRHKELVPLLQDLANAQQQIYRLRAEAQGLPGVAVPPGWNPLTESDQQALNNRLSWLRWAAQAVQPNSISEVPFQTQMRAFLEAAPPVHENVIAWLYELAAAWEALTEIPAVDRAELERWTGAATFLEVWTRTRAGRALDGTGSRSLDRWVDLLRHVETLSSVGLHHARSAILDGALEADDAAAAFERGLAESSLDERKNATGLDDFDAHSHERTIDRFTTRAALVRELLKRNLAAGVVNSRRVSSSSTSGRMGELQRQLTRQRGGLTVRKLMESYTDLITQIMPCTLVSPDSVARFFPARADLFDIVVFDEASQIRVADAVGAMGRGASVVVVGDSKQMPPTSFAETSSDSLDAVESEITAVEDMESILSECVEARVPRQWLSWHYRSQDESLIAFSNQQYYESKLSSFPGPSHGAPDPGLGGHGVNFVRVNGQFHRSGPSKVLRTNPVEAAAVVQEVRRRFNGDYDSPSVGVVTFNLQQRALIEGLLRDTDDTRIIKALDEDPEGLFVKNLENVQGDERDVILFSTGFSKNDKGYLPLNFGPLNRAGGERRLNVAVTRARRQVIVFSSFSPSELRAEETSSVGIKHLRSYLDLAEQGTGALPYDGRRTAAVDLHREDIADALRDRGFLVATDVGLSDFKVDISLAASDRPDRPLMAVLLDSPAWAARRTAGDRDGLPGDVLTRMMRWPAVERVWLPAWINDRNAVLDKLEAAFTKAAETSSSKNSFELVSVAEERPVESVDVHARPHAEEPAADRVVGGAGLFLKASEPRQPADAALKETRAGYKPWAVRSFGPVDVLDNLGSQRAAAAVREAMRSIVDAEGPIHVERLAKLTCAAFNLNKVNTQRMNSVLRLLDRKVHQRDADGFVWDATVDRDAWEDFRPSGPETARKPEHISVVELRNAMVEIVRTSGGISVAELHRDTIRVFGGKRLTAGVTARLNEGLQYGVDTELLELRGELVHLAV